MNVYLHIGYYKTGSSALQSYFAKNTVLLKKYGVLYPEHDSFEKAKKGFVTTGNIRPKIDDFWEESIIDAVKSSNENSKILFSSEVFFSKIVQDFEKIVKLNKLFNLTIILYVRNPIDHMFSFYGQRVKRGGEIRKIDEWIESFIIPDPTEIIRLCSEKNINIKVINYSNINQIEVSFMKVLLPQEYKEFLIDARTNVIVNRSLNRTEYELQRKFNQYYGQKSSRFIADTLVNNVPSIASEKEYIDEKILDSFINKNKEIVEYINTFLDDENKLDLIKPKQLIAESIKYELTKKQIEVLAASISERMLKSNHVELRSNDAETLRDIALKYEKNEPLSLTDAHYLMSLAHKARPGGNVIKNKLNFFTKQLIIE